MPLFLFVFGTKLAAAPQGAEGSAQRERTLQRLYWTGVVAVPGIAGLTSWRNALLDLNVMFAFVCIVLIVQCLQRPGWVGALLALGVFVLGGATVEYGWPGLCFGLAVWQHATRPRWTTLCAAILALAAFAWPNGGNCWALAAVGVIVIATRIDLRIARMRWFFYLFYALHFYALLALRIPLKRIGYVYFGAACLTVLTLQPASALAQASTVTVVVRFADDAETAVTFRPSAESIAKLSEAKRAALITVRGRTSATQPSAADENLALNRALAARAYLVAQGVSPLKISINHASALDPAPVGDGRNSARVEIDMVFVAVRAGRLVAIGAVAPEGADERPLSPDPDMWRSAADDALAQYKEARRQELLALVAQERSLGAGAREAYERLQALNTERARARDAIERRNNEPSPRVYLPRDWKALGADQTLRGTLARWASIEQVPLNWVIDWDYPLLGDTQVTGDLPAALRQLERRLPAQQGKDPSLSIDPRRGLTVSPREAQP